MTKASRNTLRPALLAGMLATIASPAPAQDFGTTMLLGMGKSILSDSEKMLNSAPDMLDDILTSAEQGHMFDTPEACLGALQVAVNAGVLASNALPFSTVHTFEDERGPVGRFRMLINGDKLHLDAFCRDEQLSTASLPWGAGNPEPVAASRTSLDAVAGVLLLLQAQGAFGKDDLDVALATTPSTTANDDQGKLGMTPLATGRPDLISEALSKALNQNAAPTPTIGPPMTSGERNNLRASIQQCWNVGNLSSEALRTTVVVAFSIAPDRRPQGDTIRLIDYDGGGEGAARQAFEAARRAIIRCGANSFDLPADKFSQWGGVEMTFNAETMQIR